LTQDYVYFFGKPRYPDRATVGTNSLI
jgi:hypothetical protein